MRYAVLALLLLCAQQFIARAKAVGRADAEAATVERLTAELGQLTDDTLRLSDNLAALDREHAVQAEREARLIADLESRATQAERELAVLQAADPLREAEMAEAFTALEDLIGNPPELRAVRHAVDARVSGLVGQVAQIDELRQIAEAELAVTAFALERERVGRSAANALLDGLRAQVGQQTEIIDTQAREIDALRDAVSPGLAVSLKGWWLLPVGIAIGWAL